MVEPSRRIAAALFAVALLTSGVGTWAYAQADPRPHNPEPSQTTVIKPVAPPATQSAAIVAVVATPTPEPTPEPTPVPTPVPTVVPTRVPTPVPTVARAPVQAPVTTGSSADFEAMLRAATIATWGEAEWPAMRTLIYNESGMNPYAINKSSGACSAFQFLPCAKLGAPMSDFNNQIAKGIEYIRARYTTPSRALAYWRCIGWCVNNYGGVQKTATWY